MGCLFNEREIMKKMLITSKKREKREKNIKNKTITPNNIAVRTTEKVINGWNLFL